MSDALTWLKRAEHGSLGEARARSFLLERFWVLERSIDKDGADYLIQRRLTNENFLSREPPRLGVVQVKFVQDENTAIYIPAQYVRDEHGHPYSEFFLLVHTGNEDCQRQFLLTARQISENFEITSSDSASEKYRLSGKTLLQDSKYEVLSKGRALETIDHALKNADFLRNRAYFASSHYVKIEKHHIDRDYLLPVENAYCEIDKEFYEQKQKLQHTLFEMEEVSTAIGKILRSTDPIEAYNIFEESIDSHITGGGWRHLSFSADFFDDEDFITAAKNHLEHLKQIRNRRLENEYFKLLDEYESQVMQWIFNHKAWERTDALQVTSRYDRKTLKHLTVKLVFTDSQPKETHPVVAKSRPGLHVLIYRPSSLDNRWNQKDKRKTEEIVKANAWQIRRPFQRELDIHLLGKELGNPRS